MLQRFAEVINGKAFRPDKANSEATIAERFRGGAVVGFAFTQNRIKAVTIRFDGHGRPVHFSEPTSRILSDDIGQMQLFIEGYARKAKVEEAVALVSHGWIAELAGTNYEGPDVERNRLLRDDPREVIGASPVEDMQYAVVGHPAHNKSVVFGCKKDAVTNALDPLLRTNLTLCRVQIGCFSMLYYLATMRPNLKGKDLLLVDENGVLLLFEHEGDWTDLAFRSDGEAGIPENVIPKMLGRRPEPHKPIAYASTLDVDFEERLRALVEPDTVLENLFGEAVPPGAAKNPEFLGLVLD